jgi:hypothetical protein
LTCSDSADVVTPPPPDASFTLWASGDATTPWLMLQVARDRPPFVFTDSSRRLAGGFELVSRRGQLSTTDVVIDIGGRWTASIRAFGIDDDALTRFASGLQLVDGLVVVDDAVTEQLGLSVTHTDQWAAQLLYGTVTSEMRSLTAQGTTITLRAAPGALDERRALLPFFTTGLVGGADRYTTGTLVATGEAIVIWATDGHLLSLTGATTPHRLLSIARSVRRAGAREWQQLLYGLHPDYRLGEFAEVARAGTGTDDSGAWKAGLQLAQRDGRTEYLWWWTWPDAHRSDAQQTGMHGAAATYAAGRTVCSEATVVGLLLRRRGERSGDERFELRIVGLLGLVEALQVGLQRGAAGDDPWSPLAPTERASASLAFATRSLRVAFSSSEITRLGLSAAAAARRASTSWSGVSLGPIAMELFLRV